jgi:hypothetical protein
MVIVYHADDETHGEQPGQICELTFEQLVGAWPDPEGARADM